jgi:hypothetical protein
MHSPFYLILRLTQDFINLITMAYVRLNFHKLLSLRKLYTFIITLF